MNLIRSFNKLTSRKYFFAGTADKPGIQLKFWRIRWAAFWYPVADVVQDFEASLEEEGYTDIVITAFNRV